MQHEELEQRNRHLTAVQDALHCREMQQERTHTAYKALLQPRSPHFVALHTTQGSLRIQTSVHVTDYHPRHKCEGHGKEKIAQAPTCRLARKGMGRGLQCCRY